MPDDAPERDVIERAKTAYLIANDPGDANFRLKAAIRVVLADMDRWQQTQTEFKWRACVYARSIGIDLEESENTGESNDA